MDSPAARFGVWPCRSKANLLESDASPKRPSATGVLSIFGLDENITRENAPANFLKLFYPYHYTVGMEVEKHLRGDLLDRHQAVILWIIRSKGEDSKRLPRKVIETLIGEWYEVGSSFISKTLRKMAAPPLQLIDIQEHPASGREKIIVLTPNGEQNLAGMVERASKFISSISAHLDDKQILAGMDFMERVSEIVETELTQ